MKTNESFHFVELNEQNIAWFPVLFDAAFGKKVSLEWVKKKYDFSYLNQALLGIYAMNAENKPVGFIGLCLFYTKYQDIQELSCHFTDSMVLPQYQGQGLYLKLLAKMEEFAAEKGMKYSIGFPNDNSYYPVVHKRKWEVPIKMVGYRIPASKIPLQAILSKLKLEKLYLRWAKSILQPYQMEFQEACLEGNFDSAFILHDQNFFRHRQTPAHFLLKIEDTAIWIRLAKNMEVGSFMLRDEAKIHAILATLKVIAKKLFIHQIILQFTAGTFADEALKGKYERFDSWPVLYKSYGSAIPKEKIEYQYCDNDNF